MNEDKSNDIYNSNSEQFISLCSLQDLKYSKYSLKHNLYDYNIVINKL